MKYTPQQRTEAVNAYTTHGTAEASRRTGIPPRTIRTWAKQAGATAATAAANQKNSPPAKAEEATRVIHAWGDYREREAMAAGAEAAHARQTLRHHLDQGDTKAAKDCGVIYGIMVDKAELLSGRATQRVEAWATSELDRSLRELVDEMENVVRRGERR